MELVIDTSALIAVIIAAPERDKIIEITKGNTLIGPGSIPWEIGNAFSAMFKLNRVSMKEADKGIQIFNTIPIRYIETDFSKILYLSKENNMYAYDAYFLDCAIRHRAPLLTLDKKLRIIAESLNIETLEV